MDASNSRPYGLQGLKTRSSQQVLNVERFMSELPHAYLELYSALS